MKKLLYIGAVLVCLVIINNLARGVYDLWHKQDLVVKAKLDLQREKEENKKLKTELLVVQSGEFIEEEARNKLFLVKPGESGVILPQTNPKTSKKEPEPANWQKWLNLFLGKN